MSFTECAPAIFATNSVNRCVSVRVRSSISSPRNTSSSNIIFCAPSMNSSAPWFNLVASASAFTPAGKEPEAARSDSSDMTISDFWVSAETISTGVGPNIEVHQTGVIATTAAAKAVQRKELPGTKGHIPIVPGSVRHQHRDGHAVEHAARDTAQNSLLQSRMAVSAHYQQPHIVFSRDRQNGALNITATHRQPLPPRRNAAPPQMRCKLVRRGFARLLIDRNHGHGLRADQKRHRIPHRARRKAAAVPGD